MGAEESVSPIILSLAVPLLNNAPTVGVGVAVVPLPMVFDENQQALLKDPLHVIVGPIIRARSKKIK